MRKITIGMLVFPRFQLLDIAGPSDAFGEVKVLSRGECEYELFIVGTTRGPVQSSSGLTVMPDRTIFDPCPHFDTLIIPGGLGVFNILEDTTIVDWIAKQGEECRRVSAICNGVFALGAAGMINGRTVTTHWMDVPRLGSMFKRASIEPDRIFVKDGHIYTTAGVTAGIDLSLVFIEEDFGKKMALDVAKYLVVYLRRTGGQSQFSPLLEIQASGDSVVATLQDYVMANLEARHSLESLAERLDMSPRNLTRVFKRECGMSPMSYVNDARIDVARRYLESTDLSYREIAQRCGMESADALRRIFVRRLNITPQEYRQRFRSADQAVQAA
ncbi:GlxA family transcriptional regulator [Noviherbaspirillum pedocola]|uniref:GlxA family transcriptional regulator n=1 Tax=Noviherbaspirillum pedocola TaxID=2801341 RepID=A0A934T0H4_9BURK|nr:GlxA family transcriptional regulator [Noviherbaspirillum pedocola]MBK4735113.1 GlxA family transcriptional regulator [Noviherbaspirillum pedocola]